MNSGLPSRKRSVRGALRVEMLEVRALMANFSAPTTEGLAGGRNVAASFNRMVGSLQAQIAVLAPKDAAPETVVGVVDQFTREFESASTALFGGVPRLNNLLQLQAQATRGAIDSLKLQLDAKLISLGTFNAEAFSEIQELTLSREVWPVGTPLQKYLVLATETSDGLKAVSTLASASETFTDEAAAAIVAAEAVAFRSEVLLAASTQPQVSAPVVQATSVLIAQVGAAVGQADFDTVIATATAGFAAALVEAGGTFGPGGSVGRRIVQPPDVANPLPIADAATFANLQYTQTVTTSTFMLHRNFSSSANWKGRFLSTDTFASPADAIRKLALDQSWYGTNQAYFTQDVYLPEGLTMYVGRVAPIYQGIFRREATPGLYPGGASQYLVPGSRDSRIEWKDLRATGT